MGKIRTAGDQDLAEVVSALQKCIRRGMEEEAMHWAMEMCPRYRQYLWKRLRVIVNEDIGIACPFAIILIDTLERQFFAFYEDGKQDHCQLCLANAILYLCRAKKSRIADYFQATVMQEKLQRGRSLEIPDFALDKHTGRGKSLKRGWKHFHEEGCKLEPHAEQPGEAEYAERAKKLWPTMVRGTWFNEAE